MLNKKIPPLSRQKASEDDVSYHFAVVKRTWLFGVNHTMHKTQKPDYLIVGPFDKLETVKENAQWWESRLAHENYCKATYAI